VIGAVTTKQCHSAYFERLSVVRDDAYFATREVSARPAPPGRSAIASSP